MTQRDCSWKSLIAACTVAWIGALAGSGLHANAARGPQTQRAPDGQRSVWDGVYTEAQAARGQMQYEYSCQRCHLEELQGDSSRDVPALNDEPFLKYWSGRTVKELFDLTTKTMPADNPAGLRATSYLDILAYVLQANDFPAGSEELEAERLDRIVIARAPSETIK